jgi:hypothetical protein
MAIDSTTFDPCPSVSPPILFYLRGEGALAAALSAILYARSGASWWTFAVLWLVPDLTMLGYLVDSCWGARLYNSVHSYITPASLAVVALVLHQTTLVPFALIWANHIAVDRLLGYGLKYPQGFAWTHLGRLQKRNSATQPQS